jgi:hypothetical protein
VSRSPIAHRLPYATTTRWNALAGDFRDALDNLERVVAENYVDTVAVTPDGREVPGRGWGVWVQPPRNASHPRDGQYGILGTAAGLELMASTRDFRNDVADPERKRLIVDSWCYLHASLDAAGGPKSAEGIITQVARFIQVEQPWGQGGDPEDHRRSLLIRQAQVLRCLSALEHHISALATNPETKPPLGENRRLARELVAAMSACREEPLRSELPGLSAIGGAGDTLTVFRFSSADSGTDKNLKTRPEDPVEWAYLWASFLVGITRCYLAYFIEDEQFNELVSTEDLDQLASWAYGAVRSENPDELRVGLFVGWAIVQLDELFRERPERDLGNLHFGGIGETVDRDLHHLEARPSPRWRRKLDKAMVKGAKRVIKEPALRSDLHHPYSFHIAVSSRGADKFRQDHLVVPTLPIALWLTARLQPKAFFDSRFQDLAKEFAEPFVDEARWQNVVQGQSSTFNGTVNMNYIHEAVAELHDLARRTSARTATWRQWARLHGIRSWLRAAAGTPRFALAFGLFLVIVAVPVSLAWHLIGVSVPADDSAPAAKSRVAVQPQGPSQKKMSASTAAEGQSSQPPATPASRHAPPSH